MNGMIDLKFVDFLNTHELSSEEFIICYLIHQDKHQSDVNDKFAIYVENNAGKFDYKKLLNELENKDFIINYNKPDQYDLSKLKATDKFIDLLFVSKDIAFQEVLTVYPKSLVIREKGQKEKVFPAFGNMETDAMLYFNFIDGRRDKHVRFLAITEKFTEMNNNIASYKFENYLLKFSSIAMMIEEQHSNGLDDFEILS